jgi:hypothetical protein
MLHEHILVLGDKVLPYADVSRRAGAAIAITLHQISCNPRIEWLVRKELREVISV